MLWCEMISNCCKLFLMTIHVILALQSNTKPWMSRTNYYDVIIQTGPPQHPKLWPTSCLHAQTDTCHLKICDLFYSDHCIITIITEMSKNTLGLEDVTLRTAICECINVENPFAKQKICLKWCLRCPWWTQIEPHITKAKHEQHLWDLSCTLWQHLLSQWFTVCK